MGLLVALGMPGPAAAQGEDTRALFRAVLANPADIAANLRYARAVERDGDGRKAMMAYERVLSVDPANREALLGLQRLTGVATTATPGAARTDVIVGAGIQYESNPRLLDGARSGDADLSAVGVLRLDDERQLLGRRWRSRVHAQGRLYRTFGDGSLAYVGGDTGPVFPLGEWAELRTLAGLEYARLGDGPLFASAYGGVELGLRDAGPLRGIDALVSFADFAERYPGRDGFLARLRPQFAWSGLVTDGDRLTVEPEAAWNAAVGEGHRFRYWSLAAAGFYASPVASGIAGFQQILAGPELTVEHRRYAAGAEPGAADRRDWRISPGLRLVGSGFLEQDLSVVLRYYVDNNRSNEADKEYTNHTVSLVVYRRF
ncbi:hypothetical protein [Stella sp.]|uniref:hypothetical protein n=1 Tax=Stella sp. TaxID=2912054 RepID=UPI0035B13762